MRERTKEERQEFQGIYAKSPGIACSHPHDPYDIAQQNVGQTEERRPPNQDFVHPTQDDLEPRGPPSYAQGNN